MGYWTSKDFPRKKFYNIGDLWNEMDDVVSDYIDAHSSIWLNSHYTAAEIYSIWSNGTKSSEDIWQDICYDLMVDAGGYPIEGDDWYFQDYSFIWNEDRRSKKPTTKRTTKTKTGRR